MAQLVHLKSPPHRHHALHKEQVLAINRTISEHKQRVRLTFPLIHHEFERQKEELLRHYLFNKQQASTNASLLARKSNARRLAASTITLLYRWHYNIEREAQAMFLLSQKIAETVLNNTHLDEPAEEEINTITDQLKNYFNIIILLPQDPLTTANDLSANLAHYFDQLPFLTVGHHDKSPQLKICWQGETRILDLDHTDLGWILGRAIKNIIKIKHLL